MSAEISADERQVLDLAERLGHWPSWRQVKTELRFSSPRTSIARNGAEPHWSGQDSPRAKHRPTTKEPRAGTMKEARAVR